MQYVRNEAISYQSLFAKRLAQLETTSKDKGYGVTNMTPDMQAQFQDHLSIAVTEATTWSLADTECITDQHVRKIPSITSYE